MTKYFLTFYLVLIAMVANAQSVTLFKDVKGNLYTRRQVDSIVAEKNKKLKDVGLIGQLSITGQSEIGDTLIHTYTLKVSSEEVLKNDEKKSGYINKKLPSFSFRTMNGQEISSDALKGKPIVINMWFTTCAPCIAEMPELNALQEKYKKTDIVFLSMTYESKAKVADFLKKHAFNFQHIPDVKAYCELFTNNYPVNIFVDRNGIVLDVQNGMPVMYDFRNKQLSDKVNPEEFEKALKRIL